MDTSSIPSNATVNSVAANISTSWGGNYTYTVYGNSQYVGSCSVSQGTCNNVAAPTNSIVPGGVTNFGGDCGVCGGYYNYDTGDRGYGGGMLMSFGLTATYTYAPSSISIATSPAGRTFTVDGTNYSSAQTFQWIVGSQHTIAINTTTQGGGTGTQYVYTSWSDAGGVSHTITTPVQVSASNNTSYTFSGFLGALTGMVNPQRLTVSSPATVTANFTFGPGYGYYYSDPLTSINAANWAQSGVVSAGASGLSSSDANGGALISTATVPGGSTASETWATLTLAQSGGTYVSYLGTSADALSGPGARGSFIAIELQKPTFSRASCTAVLAAYHRVSGASGESSDFRPIS